MCNDQSHHDTERGNFKWLWLKSNAFLLDFVTFGLKACAWKNTKKHKEILGFSICSSSVALTVTEKSHSVLKYESDSKSNYLPPINFKRLEINI